MKTVLNTFICTMLMALVLVSCNEDALDSLTGKYAPPDTCRYTVLDSQSRDKNGSLFLFTVNLSGENSNTLKLKFIASDYSLPASDYTPSESAANKTYLTGSNGSTCNGQQIVKGTISVSVDGSNYKMEGILYLADGSVVKMTASFSVTYEYLPIYTYSVATETPAMGGAYGNTPLTGTSKHKITVFADGVEYAHFEVVANETATSLSGTYTVKGTLDAPGQAGNGYYFDWSWYGAAGIMQGGSYYIKNGERMYLREGGGELTLTDDGSTLTIAGSNLKLLDLPTLISSKGATTQNLDETGNVKIESATKAMATLYSASATDLTAYGKSYTVTLKLATRGVTPSYNTGTQSWDYAGSGNVLSLDFKRDSAALMAGTYNVKNNNTAAVGDCYAGYNFYGMTLGCTWGTVTNGVLSSNVFINSGTVEVIADGNNYIVVVDVLTDAGSVQTTYYGPITF